MVKLAISTFLRNAASVLVGRHGSVAEQAKNAGCSRQTVYNDAHTLLQRVEDGDRRVQELQAERDALREEVQTLRSQLQQAVTITEDRLRHFAVVSQAMGVSLRQTEELLGILLPKDRVPDHTVLGRWTAEAGRLAGKILTVLDPLCRPCVTTLCVDEIFFGG